MKPIKKEISKGIFVSVCAKCEGHLYKCQGLHTCMKCHYTHDKENK